MLFRSRTRCLSQIREQEEPPVFGERKDDFRRAQAASRARPSSARYLPAGPSWPPVPGVFARERMWSASSPTRGPSSGRSATSASSTKSGGSERRDPEARGVSSRTGAGPARPARRGRRELAQIFEFSHIVLLAKGKFSPQLFIDRKQQSFDSLFQRPLDPQPHDRHVATAVLRFEQLLNLRCDLRC